jgi:hypothetical protein
VMPARARPRLLVSTVWKSDERTRMGRLVCSASSVSLVGSVSSDWVLWRSQLTTSSQVSGSWSAVLSRKPWMRVCIWARVSGA